MNNGGCKISTQLDTIIGKEWCEPNKLAIIYYRMARLLMDIDQSISFIEAKGSDLEKERLYCILHGTTLHQEIIQGFIELHNNDGCFPFRMQKGNLSMINETTVALWWMEELELLASPTAKQAFAYLLSTQQKDGSWDEDPRIAQYELPLWIKLGDPMIRHYLSAYVTYWLAVGGYINLPAFRRAIHFLIRSQDKSGRFYGYLHTTWIAVGTLLMAGDRYAPVARMGIQALSDKPLTEWDDSQIAWALDCLDTGGLPVYDPFVQGCLGELSRRQKSDGSWVSEDGEAYAVGATIQALKALKRYGILSESLD